MGTGFPKRSSSNEKIERDGDSKKRRPALVERAQQFFVPLLDALVAVAGDREQPFRVEDRNVAPADLNEADVLQGALDQILGPRRF